MVFCIRERLIRQRPQPINALGGHLPAFGQVGPQGASHISRLIKIVEDPASGLTREAVATLQVLIAALRHLETEMSEFDVAIARPAKEDDLARRLRPVPAIGPLIATAFATLAPSADTCKKRHDFAAWLGLVPQQHSTGGTQRLGVTTKMGARSLRRLRIIGANSLVMKRHVHALAQAGTWLGQMLTRTPPMLVPVALAHKMARILWALMASAGVPKAPVAAA